jgi:hypothetical protein
MSEAQQSKKGCLGILIPLVVVLALAGGGVYLIKQKEAAEERKRQEHLNSPEVYRSKITVNLKMEIREANEVHLHGVIGNAGDRKLSNVRLKISYMTKPVAGENRPTSLDLGPFKPKERRPLRKHLYTIPGKPFRGYGGHYKISVDEVTYAE